MKTLHISVSNKVAEYRERDGFIVCGNSNYQVEFAFDSEWDEHEEKTARFIWNNQYFDQEFTGNVCPCPIIYNTTEVSVGVYAGNLETTTGANIPCIPSILCGEATQSPESAERYTNEAKQAAEEAKALAEAEFTFPSVNLYDPSKQTDETISPHYYVAGVPYSTTQFDSSYHTVAPIAVEGDTEYTIAVVPAVNGHTRPWGAASWGVFFYDADGKYISSSTSTKNTFKTPANARTIRFNYARGVGISLGTLNARCVIVKGAEMPTAYIPYGETTVKDHVITIEEQHTPAPIYCEIANEVVSVASKYGADNDFVLTMQKKGGNNLFDIYQRATIPNSSRVVSSDLSSKTVFSTSGGDWFAPFIVVAKNNIDGDKPDGGTFTGGNHQYNNNGSGSTATARCANIRFFVDGREVTAFKGYAHNIEIRWTNFVQGANTMKEDGSGREILQENHTFAFDGNEWTANVELVPLEDIKIRTWYGFQAFVAQLNNLVYVGGTNRKMVDTSVNSECGDGKTNAVVAWGTTHKLTMEVDPTCDLGREGFGISKRCFVSSGKIYFHILNYKDFAEGERSYLRGTYKFEPI